ncbi:hypothetical protein Tco_0378794 [Tanacetum coccineum]
MRILKSTLVKRSLEFREIEGLRVFRDESNEWKEINASRTLSETVGDVENANSLPKNKEHEISTKSDKDYDVNKSGK